MKAPFSPYLRHVLLTGALLLATAAAVLHVGFERLARANAIATDAQVVRIMAAEIRREVTRDAIDAMKDLSRQSGARKPSPEEAAARTSRLREHGMLVDVARLGTGGELVHAIELPSTRRPGLRLLNLHLASTQLAATEDGRYLIPLSLEERRRLAKLLGANAEATSAAVEVAGDDLVRAARHVLQPGLELTFHPGSTAFDAVRLVYPFGGPPKVERLPSPVPPPVQADPGELTDPRMPWNWPAFLLYGGREVKHYHYRQEERSDRMLHVYYFRDDVEEEQPWRGLAIGAGSEVHEPDAPLSPWYVAAGAAVLLALWGLLLWRLRRHMAR